MIAYTHLWQAVVGWGVIILIASTFVALAVGKFIAEGNVRPTPTPPRPHVFVDDHEVRAVIAVIAAAEARWAADRAAHPSHQTPDDAA